MDLVPREAVEGIIDEGRCQDGERKGEVKEDDRENSETEPGEFGARDSVTHS